MGALADVSFFSTISIRDGAVQEFLYKNARQMKAYAQRGDDTKTWYAALIEDLGPVTETGRKATLLLGDASWNRRVTLQLPITGLDLIDPLVGGFLLLSKENQLREDGPVLAVNLNSKEELDRHFEKKIDVTIGILPIQDTPQEPEAEDVSHASFGGLSQGARFLSYMAPFQAKYMVHAAAITDVRQSPADQVTPYKDGSWDIYVASQVRTEKAVKIQVSHDWYVTNKPRVFDILVALPAESKHGFNTHQVICMSREKFDLMYARVSKDPITSSIPAAPTHSHLTPAPNNKVISLDNYTRVQLAIILLEHGTEQQKKDAGLFLADLNPEWFQRDR